MGISSTVIGISGYLWRNYTAKGQFDEIKAKHVIDDLRIIKTWIDECIENGGNYVRWGDAQNHFIGQSLMEKHSDWIDSESEKVPENERLKYIQSECFESMELLIKHGYKKALKIRKKSRKNP